MIKKLKSSLTKKQYVESQIVKYMTEAVVYECQIDVISKVLEDETKKEASIKALTALNLQVKAVNEQLIAWNDYYLTL